MPETKIPDFPPTAASVPTPDVAPQRRRSPLGVLFISLLIALLGFGGGIVGYFVADEYLADAGSASESATTPDTSDEGFQPSNDEAIALDTTNTDDASVRTPREIYRSVSPSVVHISSITETESSFFGIPQEQRSEGTGSGFVIDDKGHIVTNAHVVEGAQELTVSFGDEATGVPAKVIGEDKSSDIAVIKIDPDAKELGGLRLRPLRFGDSTKLQVGDPVLAIGNPFGLDRTLTTGVVSALQREIPALNDFQISNVIQTDAAVNPGNSGGPLLDGQGRVIGVNSQIQSRTGSFAGVAFAVPSMLVRDVASELIKEGKVEYAWLGVAGGEITPDLVEEYDLPVDKGVLIGTVTAGSPADKAGLEGGRQVTDLSTGEARREGGDIIVSFDGVKVTTMVELAGIVDAKDPGDKVKIEYLRDGRKKTTTVTLGERPDDVDGQEG